MSLDIDLVTSDIDGNTVIIPVGNITHNLTAMADEADLYYALWRPEEKGWKYARDIVDTLGAGVARLHAEPDRFRTLNPHNGWGSYEGLLEFATKYLELCRKYPSARIEVSR